MAEQGFWSWVRKFGLAERRGEAELAMPRFRAAPAPKFRDSRKSVSEDMFVLATWCARGKKGAPLIFRFFHLDAAPVGRRRSGAPLVGAPLGRHRPPAGAAQGREQLRSSFADSVAAAAPARAGAKADGSPRAGDPPPSDQNDRGPVAGAKRAIVMDMCTWKVMRDMWWSIQHGLACWEVVCLSA